MENKNLGMLEAIQLAMEAELKASKFYSKAREETKNDRGKNLLQQLANFEQKHYDKLTELKDSLEKQGKFIKYVGTKFETFNDSQSEVSGKLEQNKDDVLNILTLAIEAESKAFERYKKMSQDTDDPNGKDMFQKLAEEEAMHRRILSDEFYQMSNMGGVWSWGD